MSTQTQTLPQRTTAQASRVHDYLYDPNFIVSGERDHVRTSMVAQASNSRIKCLPIFNTMFSELRHQPRLELRLDTTDPVPQFIPRQWRGLQDKAQNNSASLQLSSFSHGDPVSGANRYKYFRRPMIPFSQSLGPEIVLASARQDALSARRANDRRRTPTPSQKTVQTQTDYRDSEAQTDPYSPDYVVKPGTQPEVLTLALLSYECGLPAGLAEVEMIERARAKRAWELTLPPLTDTAQLDKRRRMMEEQERREWALREQEIDRLQEARLKVLIKLLQQREEQNEELNTKCLNRLWARKQLEKKEKVAKIRHEFMRAVRKLTLKKGKVEGKLERRSLVADYSSFGSQAFAPLTRIGVFVDRLADQYVVKNRYLMTYDGLVELENSMPDYILQPVVRPPKRQLTTSTGFMKRKYRQEMELAGIHKNLKEKQLQASQPPKPLRFLQKVERPLPRPTTPSVEIPKQSDEDRELATIFLQQVLRGRSVQNMMYEGKEKRMELIQELRSTHALQGAGQMAMNQQKMAALQLQKQQELFQQKESTVDEALSAVEGESLGDALDFLNKELIRLQEERRIHAFSMLAERQRRIREAEESGLRQVEERRRREEDEIFKQVVKVHQGSVDAYLEDIILVTLERKADEQARSEIQVMAEQINDAAYEAETRRTEMQSEEIVAELVYGFLLPEVQKQYVREKVHEQQRKFLVAAHREIHDTTHDACKDLHSRPVDDHQTTSRSQSRSSQNTQGTGLQDPSDPKPGSRLHREKSSELNGQPHTGLALGGIGSGSSSTAPSVTEKDRAESTRRTSSQMISRKGSTSSLHSNSSHQRRTEHPE